MSSVRSKSLRSTPKRPTGELSLIDQIRKRAARIQGISEVALGIGDDCAILRPLPGEELVVTTDFSLEGRHFRRDRHPAASIGHRALARGLSDVAAMGARPMAAFLSLALPADAAGDTRWFDAFLGGLLALAKDHEITLAGGDTAQAPGDNVLIDIVVMGAAPTGSALRRSGANAGDVLYCTGRLGGATKEFEQLSARPLAYRNAKRSTRLYPHLYPEPRVAVGLALRERGIATACIDLSDGLSTDLAHLCRASAVGAEVEFDALPRAASLRALPPAEALHFMARGGEDYELLFTAAPHTGVPKKIAGVSVTRIGRVVVAEPDQPRITLIESDGSRSELEPGGWEHFISR